MYKISYGHIKTRKRWQTTTAIITGLLMLSLHPEVRLVGVMIEVIGLDILLLFFEAQVLIGLGTFYQQQISPVFTRVNQVLEKIDRYYFLPSTDQVKESPVIILHIFPFLVAISFIFYRTAMLYS